MASGEDGSVSFSNRGLRSVSSVKTVSDLRLAVDGPVFRMTQPFPTSNDTVNTPNTLDESLNTTNTF